MLGSLWLWASSTPLYGCTLNRQRLTISENRYDLWEGEDTIGQHILTNGMQVGSKFMPLEDLIHSLGDPHIKEIPAVHSFEWLRHLKKLGHNMSRKMARHLLMQWIVGHQSYRDLPWQHWQAGILGYRIYNWLMLYDFFGTSADDAFRKAFWASLSQQVHHLTRMPLYLLPPQQRWMALKGLIVSTQAVRRYLPRIEATLGELLYQDGSHKDLAFQLFVLRDLVDLQRHIQIKEGIIPEAIRKMAGVVRFLRNSDGLLCPLVPLSPFGACSSHFVDMVLSMCDVQQRPPTRLPFAGIERIQHSLGLFFVQTRGRAQRIIPRSVGVLDWVWTPQNSPMMISDISLEGISFREHISPDILCDVRQAKRAGQKIIWQGRYPVGDSFLHRELVMSNNMLQGRDQFVVGSSQDSVHHSQLWARFHLPAQVEHLETLGHFQFQGKVWKLTSQVGVLEKTKDGGLRIGNASSEGVKWTFAS